MTSLDSPPDARPLARRCRLSVLGGFGLEHDRAPVALPESGARVLAYLAVNGRHRAVPRAQLAERLCADPDPARSAGRLRSTLWRLPRVAGRPLVEGGQTAVRLAEFVDVDLWRAEDAAQELRADAPPEPSGTGSWSPVPADVSFAEDLLPDWPEDWLVLERESFRQLRLHALERASSALCRGGRHEAALRTALTAVACEPLRETAHRRVIEAHLAEGNHAEALRQYQTYRQLLAAELGLAPTGAIRTLVAPLLGRPVDTRPDPAPVPRPRRVPRG